jgi:hypothetical protein
MGLDQLDATERPDRGHESPAALRSSLSDVVASETITLPRRFVGVGVVVALVPVVGFCMAYVYEVGFARGLGIDTRDIAVSSANILNVGGRFVGLSYVAMLVMLQTANFGIERLRFRSRSFMYAAVLAEAALLWAGANLFVEGFTWRRALLSLLAAGGLLLVPYVGWSYFRWGTGFQEHTPTTKAIIRLIESGYFPLVVGLVIAFSVAYSTGFADARHQTRFFVPASDPHIVVLRRYGDELVGARLIAPHVIGRNSEVVLRAGDAGAREFVRRDVGPLRRG